VKEALRDLICILSGEELGQVLIQLKMMILGYASTRLMASVYRRRLDGSIGRSPSVPGVPCETHLTWTIPYSMFPGGGSGGRPEELLRGVL
jgi:hypothetical protein